MGPNQYPEAGPDWYTPDKVSLPDPHAEALKAEQYTHELMGFRADVWQTLANKNVLVEGSGWAIFTVTEEGSSVATADYKEVMIEHRLIGAVHPLGDVTAAIRIITKEQVDTGDGNLHYIFEDMMFDLENNAVYSIDTLTYEIDGETFTLPDEFKGKPIPMFGSVRDGSFQTYGSFPTEPVQLTLIDPAMPKLKLMPFGRPKNYDDRHYALTKAKALFEEVRDREPTFQSVERS